MINIDCLQINANAWQSEDDTRIQTLRLVLAGFSNNCVAKELNFSLKNIESIIAKLFRKCGIITRGQTSHLINPRVRLLVNGLRKDWLRYTLEDRPRNSELLSRNQYLTLILCAAGSSNKAVADFLCISSKTVESRLNSLFSCFNVASTEDMQVNHRIRLIVNAIRQKSVSTNAIRIASELLNFENWEQIINNREDLKENFLRLQFDQARPYFLSSESSVQTLADRVVAAQQPKLAGAGSITTSPNSIFGGFQPRGALNQLSSSADSANNQDQQQEALWI